MDFYQQRRGAGSRGMGSRGAGSRGALRAVYATGDRRERANSWRQSDRFGVAILDADSTRFRGALEAGPNQ